MTVERKEYQFAVIGSATARRSLIELAEAHRELAKAEGALARTRQRATVGNATAEARARVRAQATESTETRRAADRSARAVERAEQAKTRAVERESEKRARAYRRAGEAEARSVQRMVDAERRHERKRSTLTGMAGRGSSVVGMVGGATLAYGGGSLLSSATRERALQEKQARALAVSGGARDQHRQLLDEATKSALGVRGTRVEDVLAAQQRYVAMTGDLGAARDLGGTFATAARATGATETDIAATAASLSTKFGITKSDDMKKALAVLVQGGKSGAFELGDAASYFQEMGAAGSRFGLDQGAGGVAQLSAMAQLARMSTGSGAEASTGVSAMLRQLQAKSDDIRRLNGGKEVVFADKGKTQTNDVVDVLANTLKATKGNRAQLQSIFGDEGMKGASELVKRFTEAGDKLGPAATEAQRLAAGERAVRDAFAELSGSAGKWSDVVADAATMTASSGATMTTAWERISAGIGDKLAPSVAQFADALLKAAPAIVQMSGGAANAIGALGRFGSMATKLAERLGLDVGEEAPAAALPDAVQLIGKQSAKGALDAKISAGTATPADLAEARKLGTEISGLQTRIEAPFKGTIQSLSGRREHEANVRAGKTDDYTDIRQARWEARLDAGTQVMSVGGLPGAVGAQIGKGLTPVRGDPTSFGLRDYAGGGAGPIPALLDKASTLGEAADKHLGAARALESAAQSLTKIMAPPGGGRPPTSLPGT